MAFFHLLLHWLFVHPVCLTSPPNSPAWLEMCVTHTLVAKPVYSLCLQQFDLQSGSARKHLQANLWAEWSQPLCLLCLFPPSSPVSLTRSSVPSSSGLLGERPMSTVRRPAPPHPRDHQRPRHVCAQALRQDQPREGERERWLAPNCWLLAHRRNEWLRWKCERWMSLLCDSTAYMW